MRTASTTTRANIHLDNDAYDYAYAYAHGKGIPLGAAVSELLRQRAEMKPGETVLKPPKFRKTEKGYWVLAAAGRPLVTPEMVKELSEDEFEY